MSAEPHPDFVAAGAGLQWTDTLPKLMAKLLEVAPKRQGNWAYYVLPGGACVAMKVDKRNFGKVLRISRRTIKDPSEARFAAEVAIFAKKMGVEDWLPATITITRGLEEGDYHAEAVLDRPFGGKDTALQCARCGNTAEPGSEKYREVLCNRCALAAGNADTAARQAARA